MLVAIKTLRDLIQQVMADFEPIGRLGMARPAGCYPPFALSRHQAHLSFGSTLSLSPWSASPSSSSKRNNKRESELIYPYPPRLTVLTT